MDEAPSGVWRSATSWRHRAVGSVGEATSGSAGTDGKEGKTDGVGGEDREHPSGREHLTPADRPLRHPERHLEVAEE